MTASSAGTIPRGLELYTFEYAEPRGLPANVVCLDGECVAQPPEIFLSSVAEAERFANERGATHFTHALTSRRIRVQPKKV